MLRGTSVVFLLALLAASSADVSEEIRYDVAEEAGATARNVSLGDSNMPASWQVTAARAVEEAYELQTTDSGRLSLISDLFSEAHPFWYWNVALNYRYAFHHGSYYVQVLIDGDEVYLFATR